MLVNFVRDNRARGSEKVEVKTHQCSVVSTQSAVTVGRHGWVCLVAKVRAAENAQPAVT